MPANVLIIDAYAETYAERLHAAFPDLAIRTVPSLAALPDDISDAEVMIAFGIGIDDAVLRRATGLKWIQCLATGVDHFLKAPSMRSEVILTSTRGIHGPQMREMALFLMLAVGQDVYRIVGDRDAHRWNRQPRWLLWRKTAVVVGVGVSGIAIGRALKALEMRVIGVTRTPRDIDGFDATVATDRLAEVAAEADYLINVLPSSPKNVDLIGRAVFGAMKPSAVFINLGRGDTVDEDALLEVLKAERIAGAGLDVFRDEPLPPDSPFWDLPNAFVTSHLGGFCREYEDQALGIIVDNMRAYLDGRIDAMRNVVDH